MQLVVRGPALVALAGLGFSWMLAAAPREPLSGPSGGVLDPGANAARGGSPIELGSGAGTAQNTRDGYRSTPTSLLQDTRNGYRDTPLLPGGKWRVHDADRPPPASVTPGECGSPPSDAIVLFDGKDLSAWRSGDKPAAWKVTEGYAEVNGSGNIETRASFGDCQVHIEWAEPTPVKGESQGRGNSGIFLMGRYEVQVLDSYENRTYADGQCAALYGQEPPLVNACRRPGEWQSYDILFRAPRFDGDKLVSPAVVTVLQNGVVVHHAMPFLGATAHKALPHYAAHPAEAPLALQDHGDPVRYRNIWIRRLP